MRNFITNKMVFITFLLILVASFNTINFSQQSVDTESNRIIETFEIDSSMVFCEQIVPRKCLQVKRGDEKQFKPLWDNIENFEFIGGYKYVLKVEVEKIKYPPKDTSGFKFYLKEIVSREKVETNNQLTDLYISKWYLTHINGKKVESGKPFIVFRSEDKSFYGNTGCNSMGGTFEVNSDKLNVSGVRQTKRACSNMRDVESPFMQMLTGDSQIEVEQDRLYFKQNGKIVLEFKSNWS